MAFSKSNLTRILEENGFTLDQIYFLNPTGHIESPSDNSILLQVIASYNDAKSSEI